MILAVGVTEAVGVIEGGGIRVGVGVRVGLGVFEGVGVTITATACGPNTRVTNPKKPSANPSRMSRHPSRIRWLRRAKNGIACAPRSVRHPSQSNKGMDRENKATTMAMAESRVPRNQSSAGIEGRLYGSGAPSYRWSRRRSIGSANGKVAEVKLNLALSQTQRVVSVDHPPERTLRRPSVMSSGPRTGLPGDFKPCLRQDFSQ